MLNSRSIQLSTYATTDSMIHQDYQLIKFIKDHEIKRITIFDRFDREYFSRYLTDCEFSEKFFHEPFLLVIMQKLQPVVWEKFIEQIGARVETFRPEWVYLAVNQYMISTEIAWQNLTDDYPNDLLNTVSNKLSNYRELCRNATVDLGQNFNFAHPTTNAFYQRTRC